MGALKAVALMLLKRAGEAVVAIIVERLLTRALFEAAALQAIESLARVAARSTATTVDDDFVENELIPRLRAPGGDT